MEQETLDAEGKFLEEHKEEIEAASRWDADQTTKVEDEYGEEDDETDNSKIIEGGEPDAKIVKEKPVVPVFNKDEFLKKWLEENPVIEIPSETDGEKDTDWVLSEEDEQAILNSVLSKEQN